MVLLLLAVKDHKDDIETGRGIEPYLTDGFSGSTLRAMRPQLRSGEYGAALMTAAQTMADQIAQGKEYQLREQRSCTGRAPREVVSTPGQRDCRFPLIIFGIFFLIWLLGRGGRRGGGGVADSWPVCCWATCWAEAEDIAEAAGATVADLEEGQAEAAGLVDSAAATSAAAARAATGR